MIAARRPTPPGTWPLLVSGALFMVALPGLLLGQVVPVWLAVAGAFLYLIVAIAAVAWSYTVYTTVRSTRARGVPIAGLIVGVIVVLIAGLAVVPAAL